MNDYDKKPDSHVAYGAVMDGVTAVITSVSIVGRYWWNFQMKILQKIGILPLFKAYWWLFLIVGLFLLAFLPPLGILFVISSWCAGQMNPKSVDNFVVPLRHETGETGLDVEADNRSDFVQRPQHVLDDNMREDVNIAAAISHMSFLRALEREVDDLEFAAAALGAFDGTVQAFELELTQIEMMSMGAAFIFGQLKELNRLNEIDPERIAYLTTEAMISDALEEIRVQASQVAYGMAMALKQ